jgi:hypothetical protein
MCKDDETRSMSGESSKGRKKTVEASPRVGCYLVAWDKDCYRVKFRCRCFKYGRPKVVLWRNRIKGRREEVTSGLRTALGKVFECSGVLASTQSHTLESLLPHFAAHFQLAALGTIPCHPAIFSLSIGYSRETLFLPSR